MIAREMSQNVKHSRKNTQFFLNTQYIASNYMGIHALPVFCSKHAKKPKRPRRKGKTRGLFRLYRFPWTGQFDSDFGYFWSKVCVVLGTSSKQLVFFSGHVHLRRETLKLPSVFNYVKKNTRNNIRFFWQWIISRVMDVWGVVKAWVKYWGGMN